MSGRPFPKGNIPHNKLPLQNLICEECHKFFSVSGARKNVHTCSRLCHNRRLSKLNDVTGENNPMWKGGIQTYRKLKKEHCEKCGATNNLDVHHIDSNRYNNVLTNLLTVCRRCHQEIDGRRFNKDLLGRFLPRCR